MYCILYLYITHWGEVGDEGGSEEEKGGKARGGKGKTKENKKKLLMSKNITCNHSHDQKPYPILDAIEVGFLFSLFLSFSFPYLGLLRGMGPGVLRGGLGERRRRRKGG